MKKATFSGWVELDGSLSFQYPKLVKNFLSGLAGEAVDIVITKQYGSRSTKQNRYYWGVVIPMIQQEIGEENKEVVHGWLQAEVGHTATLSGKDVPRGTSDLSTAEFEEYTARVRMFASKFLNLYIPEPNEGERKFGQ